MVLTTCLALITLFAACKSNANNSNATITTTTNNSAVINTGNRNTTTTNTETAVSKPAPGNSSNTSSSSELHTPPDGSPERKAILDAVSAELKRNDNFDNAVFDDVESLKVHQGWAYIVTDVDDTEGAPYGLVEALLQEQNGRWKVSEVFDAPGGGVKEEREARAKFRARYVDAPDDIFPPMP
jgi:hypothetical protein